MTGITVVALFLSFIEFSYYLFLISWQCASGLRSFLPISLMTVSAKSYLYILSFFKSWWQRIFSWLQCWRLRPFLWFPFFSKVFLHRNWLVLLFRSYLFIHAFSYKTFSESTVLCFKAFFDILSPPFYFAKLAQTVLARAHILFTSIFFSDFLGAVAP